MSDSEVTWADINDGASVRDADGHEFGHVVAIVGDTDGAEFGAVVIKRHGIGHEYAVPAARVTGFTEHEVRTSLSAEEADALERYHPIRAVHGGHDHFAITPDTGDDISPDDEAEALNSAAPRPADEPR